MSHRSSTPTAETLEHQAAADSGFEELPEFGQPSSQNGVRPSEQCGSPAPPGAHYGARCTLREFHPGAHSWQPEEQQLEASEQTEPAHTPEPTEPEREPSDYDVPAESAFGGKDFVSAPGLQAIAEGWIAEIEELAHLRGIEIRYFWKRRGGLKGGNPRLGNLQRPSGLTGYALGQPVYALWIAANHCRDLKLTPEQLRAAVLHELCKSALDPDDADAFRVVGPDAEIFALEIEKCGMWSLDLREVGAHMKQLGLLDQLELPELSAPEEQDDADEGAGDE